MILSICSEPHVLEIMRIVNLVLRLVRIVVPIILMISLMLKLMKAITAGNEDGIKAAQKSIPANMIAALLVFLIPTFVSLIWGMTTNNDDYKQCLEVRTREQINEAYYKVMDDLINEAERSKDINDYYYADNYLLNIRDKDKNQYYRKKLDNLKTTIKEDKGKGAEVPTSTEPKTTTTPTNGDCATHDQYNQCSRENGQFGSFPYYDTEPNTTTNRQSLVMDPVWEKQNIVPISVTCSNGYTINAKVHRLAESKFRAAFEEICKIGTEGINGIKYDLNTFTWDGSYFARFISDSKSVSNHSWGTAIDINQNYVDPTTNIKPFCYKCNGSYDKFIGILGKEDDPRNVNYQLYKLIFKPLGFDWGGLWRDPFDGVHFELKG